MGDFDIAAFGPSYTIGQGRVGSGGTSPLAAGGASGGGGALSGVLGDYLKQLQAAQDKANAANEKRYNQILSSYDTLGQGAKQQIAGQTAQQQGIAEQGLTSRGLGNSTIRPSVMGGIAAQGQQSLLNLQDQLTQQKAGVMERRTDQQPDLSLYANLLQGIMRQPQQQSMYGMAGMGNMMGSGGGNNFQMPYLQQQLPQGSVSGPGFGSAPYGTTFGG